MRALLISALLGAGLARAVVAQEAPPSSTPKWGVEFLPLRFEEGLGVLRFTDERTAWTFDLKTGVQRYEYPDADVTTDHLHLKVGRRWYTPTREGVRSYTGLGVAGRYDRYRQENAPDSVRTTTLFRGAAVAEIGAEILVAKEIALGAVWPLSFGYERSGEKTTSPVIEYDFHRWTLDGGRVTIYGAFYF